MVGLGFIYFINSVQSSSQPRSVRGTDLALATGQCDIDEATGVCESLLCATLPVGPRGQSTKLMVRVLGAVGVKLTGSSSSLACQPWGSVT